MTTAKILEHLPEPLRAHYDITQIVRAFTCSRTCAITVTLKSGQKDRWEWKGTYPRDCWTLVRTTWPA